jgi:hypothetical protein
MARVPAGHFVALDALVGGSSFINFLVDSIHTSGILLPIASIKPKVMHDR